jgi:hypothetical protein
MNLESATLILRTINATENVGGFNNNMEWSNIDIKALLGSMWLKYKKFKIILTGHGSAPQSGMTNPNGNVSIYLEGLRWVNSSYDTSISANRSRALVGTTTYTTTGGATNYVSESGFIFDTQQTTANLRITLARIVDDTIQSLQYSSAVFIFSIYGIEED